MDSPLPITLGLESSAGRGSVALAQGDVLLAEEAVEAAHGHAAWIIPLAQRALVKAGLSFADIEAIVAGRGPGSFTGIRVALAAAKGLGLSLGLKPVGRSSLAAMAHHDKTPNCAVISLIDSRRKSIYFQAFDENTAELCPATDGQVDDIIAAAKTFSTAKSSTAGSSAVGSAMENKAKKTLLINGHQAADIARLLHQHGISPDVDIKIGAASFPSAADLCRLYAATPMMDEGLEPLYLAPPLISKAAVK